MAKSNGIMVELKRQLEALSSMNIDQESGKIEFLRNLLITLNKFFFQKRPDTQIDDLQSRFYKGKERTLDTWKRRTEFLAIWDDYAEKVLSFVYPPDRITALATRLNIVFKDAHHLRETPKNIAPDTVDPRFGQITAREFVFIRILHALQDFTQVLPAINTEFTNGLRKRFGKIPTPSDLKQRDQALEFLTVLGGADRNVDERLRYITNICAILTEVFDGDPFIIFDKCYGDAKEIYKILTTFTGIASKKANMLLRDFYEYGIWLYNINLDVVNIIADNRVMRVALRTGIVNFALPALLNDLLDQYDYQYMITVTAAEEAFRKVWVRCKELNSNNDIVLYPARFDAFFFRLANANTREGPKGCCGLTDITCVSKKPREGFFQWLKKEINYTCEQSCPLAGICLDNLKKLNPPFAIQNNTWNTIFTNDGGGGGLRGI